MKIKPLLLLFIHKISLYSANVSCEYFQRLPEAFLWVSPVVPNIKQGVKNAETFELSQICFVQTSH